MSTVVTVTATDTVDGSIPSLSCAALTDLGVTDLDPLALTVLVRSYGLDGSAPADAATLADELGIRTEQVLQLQALGAAHAASSGKSGSTHGGRSKMAGDDDPTDDVLAELEAELAEHLEAELATDLTADMGLHELDRLFAPGESRTVDARELVLLTALLGHDACGHRSDAALAALAGVEELTVTAYRLAIACPVAG